uniref:Uncharacterized protein n=1 Tax=Oryza meridionalis TaxID=40149 RepID=A0A0E0EQ23_9ORYZ
MKGKQYQENNSSLQLQRGSTFLRQQPQQVLSAPGHPTVANPSNTPRIAPIRRSIDKSPLGNTTSKKNLPATAVQRVAIPTPKVNAQSNVTSESLVGANYKNKSAVTPRFSFGIKNH